MQLAKTKTQITVSPKLALIIQSIMQNHPIYDVNKSVELLIAKGSKDYLDEVGLTMQDLEDIEISKKQIQAGQSTIVHSEKELISALKS
jgi:prophage maintenance system killer protein